VSICVKVDASTAAQFLNIVKDANSINLILYFLTVSLHLLVFDLTKMEFKKLVDVKSVIQ